MEDRRIKASRSTYEEWKQTHEDEPEKHTKDEWVSRIKPYNVYDYALMVYQDMSRRVPDARHIRIVTVDEEFEDWLEHEDLPNDLQSRVQYKNEITGADADRLLIKNRMNLAYYVMYLPIVVSIDAGSVLHIPEKLGKETTDMIKESLEAFYGEGSVYLPGDLLTPEEAFVSELRMQMLADEWFSKGAELPYPHREKSLSEYTDMILFLPLVYSAPCKRADIDLDQISMSHPEWLDPTDISLDEDIKLPENLVQMLEHDLGGRVQIGQCLIYEREVTTAYQTERDKILDGKKKKK